MAYVKVFSGSLVDTQRVMQLLQKEGVEPVLKDKSNSAMLSGFGAITPDFQELFVHEQELDKTLKIIKEHV